MTNKFENIPIIMGSFNKDQLSKSIYNDNELIELSFKDLCNQYFKSEELLKLASIRTIDGKNSFFRVLIGSPLAYNKSIEGNDNYNSKITIKSEHQNYNDMMYNFYKDMFTKDEKSTLQNSFKNENHITISLFLIDGSYNEYNELIGSVSFTSDMTDPYILLSWIGVTEKIPINSNIHQSLANENNKTFRNNYNIGSFLICTCQLLQSIIKRHWLPVICQVSNKNDGGPINFYYKRFFYKLNESELVINTVKEKYNTIIINDEESLVWMGLFYPLHKLMLLEIKGAKNAKSFQLILETGFYYFLRNETSKRFDQNEVFENLKVLCNNDDNFIESKTSFDTSDAMTEYLKTQPEELKQELEKYTDNYKDQYNKLDLILQSNPNNKIYVHDYGVGTTSNEGSCSFVHLSKLLYDDTGYYMRIRYFFYFFYRSVSLLDSDHFYYTRHFNLCMPEFVERIYAPEPSQLFKAKKIIKSLKLPTKIDSLLDEDDSIKLVYNKKIAKLLSLCFLKRKFWGSNTEFETIAPFFNIEIITLCLNDLKKEKDEDEDVEISFIRTYKGDSIIKEQWQILHKEKKKLPDKQQCWFASIDKSHFVLISNNQLNVDTIKINIITPQVPVIDSTSPNIRPVVKTGISIASESQIDIEKELQSYIVKDKKKLLNNNTVIGLSYEKINIWLNVKMKKQAKIILVFCQFIMTL
jgi:hypothetical protein